MPRNSALGAPQLLTVAGAAELLNVSTRTVLNWINDDRIPYLELPGGGRPTYRIPMHALLASLRGNYDLSRDLEDLHRRQGLISEDVVDEVEVETAERFAKPADADVPEAPPARAQSVSRSVGAPNRRRFAAP